MPTMAQFKAWKSNLKKEVVAASGRDEEAYMASVNFAGLASHKLIHADLLKTFSDHAGTIRANGGEVPSGFLMFLKLWLTAHIKGIDMKYAPTMPLKMAG